MTEIACIVEGHGEVAALPVLLRRISDWHDATQYSNILTPIRVHRDRFLNRDQEFRRFLTLAGQKCGDQGLVIILLDADDDCPVILAEDINRRVAIHLPHRDVVVVLANREFEAWFIAAAESLDGARGFVLDGLVADPDGVRNAKGWISQRMQSGAYGETIDQPAFAARFDIQTSYERSRSFRRLCDVWRSRFPLPDV